MFFTQTAFADTKPANLTEEQYQRLLLLRSQKQGGADATTIDTTNVAVVGQNDAYVPTNITNVGVTGATAHAANVNGTSADTRSNVNQAQRSYNNTAAKVGMGASHGDGSRSGEARGSGAHRR